MKTTGCFSSRPSRLHNGWASRGVGIAARGRANLVDSDFSAALLAMAGHDLRQPLQVITSAHDVLAQILHSDEQRQELARAADATAQLADMLGQLVEALQLRERSGDRLHLPVRLRPILADLAAEFAESACLNGITLRVTSAEGAALSHTVMLTGILRNLIRNAIDYTPPGGSVFQRADESRPDGLGLGLFIVKHAADLLGHRIEVSSVEGRGSCFIVVANAAKRSAPAPIGLNVEIGETVRGLCRLSDGNAA